METWGILVLQPHTMSRVNGAILSVDKGNDSPRLFHSSHHAWTGMDSWNSDYFVKRRFSDSSVSWVGHSFILVLFLSFNDVNCSSVLSLSILLATGFLTLHLHLEYLGLKKYPTELVFKTYTYFRSNICLHAS